MLLSRGKIAWEKEDKGKVWAYAGDLFRDGIESGQRVIGQKSDHKNARGRVGIDCDDGQKGRRPPENSRRIF